MLVEALHAARDLHLDKLLGLTIYAVEDRLDGSDVAVVSGLEQAAQDDFLECLLAGLPVDGDRDLLLEHILEDRAEVLGAWWPACGVAALAWLELVGL